MGKCKYCRKFIQDDKITLHQLYCENNCIKCSICGLLYDKNDKESHEEEFHKIERCQFCLNEINNTQKHVCKEKLILCNFCQMTISIIEYSQHEIECGSRTETCPYCNKYIKKMDKISHSQQCVQQRVDKPVKQGIQQQQMKYEMNQGSSNYVPNINQNQDFKQPNQKYNIGAQQNLSAQPSQNNQIPQYNLDMKNNQEVAYQYRNDLPQNPNLDQRQIQGQMQDKKYIQKPQSQFSDPNASQSQNQAYQQYDPRSQSNLPQNILMQQQFQQNQFQQVFNNQESPIQNKYGTDLQLNQQFNNNSLYLNPQNNVINEQFRYGSQNFQNIQDNYQNNQIMNNYSQQQQPVDFQQFQGNNSNYNKPNDPKIQQQRKQDYQREDKDNSKALNNNIEHINNDTIIARILRESIQADILQISYSEFKEQQKLQQQFDSKKQQNKQPTTANQNEQLFFAQEFDFLSDEQRQQQIRMYQQLQQQQNQRR